jgi:hypothetical protein
MPGPNDKTPELIVDTDWKSQAQAEKDRLAASEAKQAPESGKGRAPAPGELPPADFQTLVGMLATQAIMYLGGIPDPKTGQGIFDPDYARHMIDLLAVLQEKTKGNLVPDEEQDLAQLVHELRSRYVELSALMAQQVAARGGVGGLGGIGGGGMGGIRPGQ